MKALLIATGSTDPELPAATNGGESSEQASESAPQQPLEEFVPSEEISADRAVSFPVDI